MENYIGFFDSLYWKPEEYVALAQDLTMIGKQYAEYIDLAVRAIKVLGEKGLWTGYLYNELISKLNENIQKLENDIDTLNIKIPSTIAGQAEIQSRSNNGVVSQVCFTSTDKIAGANETNDDGKGAVYIDFKEVQQGIQVFVDYMEDANRILTKYSDLFDETIRRGMNVSKDIKLMQINIQNASSNFEMFNKQFTELISNYAYESMDIMENSKERSKAHADEVCAQPGILVDKIRNEVVNKYEAAKKCTGDEFFDKYLNNEDWSKYPTNSEKFSHIAEILKKKIYNSAKGNNTVYNCGMGINIPGGIYKDSKIGGAVDCSSFVCMTLYEYALCTENKNLTDFINSYRVDAGGSDLGPGGQITTSQFYNLATSALNGETGANNKLDSIGLKPIYYTKNRKAKKGDILVSKTHIEICTGDGNNVYSCGSDDLDSVKNVKDNSTEPTSDLVEGETPIILRITETKKKKEK